MNARKFLTVIFVMPGAALFFVIVGPSIWSSFQGNYSPPPIVPQIRPEVQIFAQVLSAIGYVSSQFRSYEKDISEGKPIIFFSEDPDHPRKEIPVNFRKLVYEDGWPGSPAHINQKIDNLRADYDDCVVEGIIHSSGDMISELDGTISCMRSRGYSENESHLADALGELQSSQKKGLRI